MSNLDDDYATGDFEPGEDWPEETLSYLRKFLLDFERDFEVDYDYKHNEFDLYLDGRLVTSSEFPEEIEEFLVANYAPEGY